MRSRNFLFYLILAAVLLLVGQLIKAGPTGQIAGTVTDYKTGDPISGASVVIAGTTMGAKTDIDGKFIILNVTPGTCRLNVSLIGYGSVLVEDVQVSADSTTEVNVQLSRSIIDAGGPAIMPDEEAIEKPVRTVDDLLCRETGPTKDADGKLSIQGSRSGKMLNIGGADYCPNPYPPAHGGTAIVNGQAFDAMFFKHYGVNPFVDTEDDHFSTFAADIDDASYIMTRSYLERGHLPPDEAVRVEEFVNHFDYGYNPPRNEAFTIHFDGSPSRFGENCHLLRIGIKGQEIDPRFRKPANLVFVIDVSGSMGREDRLSLVKKALRLLVDELKESDRVGIVIYGSRGQELLPPTSIADRHRILDAIERLQCGGSTNAEEGLRLGYRMAESCFEEGKINRIILCSDGVANVGRTGPDDLLKDIKRFAEKGITLSAVGFGMGNFNDILMEKLGNKGNGSYAYVDDIAEARRIFVDNLTGNLQVIARDVKIQVDFDPEVVRSYRLLGYENRDVDDDKFRDDQEDGGEIGSGHETTALYEIKFRGDTNSPPPARTIGTIFIRYKDPDSFEVSEISRKIKPEFFARQFEDGSPYFRLAAASAEFSEILRKSYWAKGSSLRAVHDVVKGVYDRLSTPEVLELMHLVSKAEQFQDQLAEK